MLKSSYKYIERSYVDLFHQVLSTNAQRWCLSYRKRSINSAVYIHVYNRCSVGSAFFILFIFYLVDLLQRFWWVRVSLPRENLSLGKYGQRKKPDGNSLKKNLQQAGILSGLLTPRPLHRSASCLLASVYASCSSSLFASFSPPGFLFTSFISFTR